MIAVFFSCIAAHAAIAAIALKLHTAIVVCNSSSAATSYRRHWLAVMAWEEEEEVSLIRGRKINNNKMDSNFIQMTAASSADEEQGSPTRRRTAFTALDTNSPRHTDNNKAALDTTYHSSEGDHGGYHPQQPFSGNNVKKKTNLREQLRSFRIMSGPYFKESREGRCLFAIMVVLSLANSAVRVTFSYLSRDFWSALSDKEVENL